MIKNLIDLVILFFLITPFLKVNYLNFLLASNNIYNAITVICFIIMLLLNISHRNKLLNKKLLTLYIYFLLSIFITYYNDGQIFSSLRELLLFNYFVLICEYFKQYIHIYLKKIYILLSIYVYINFFTLIIYYPNGLFSRFNEAYGYTEEYFLGAKNGFVFWIIPFLFIGAILYNKKKINYSFIVSLIISILTEYMYGSSTGIVATTLFIFMLIIFKYYKLINIYILFAGIIFINFLIVNRVNIVFLEYFIENILEKNTNFTNRDVIWLNSINAIKENLYFGYGTLNGYDNALLLGNFGDFIWLGATHAHNNLLNILFQTGIIGLVFFIMYLIKLIIFLNENFKKREYQICLAYLFTYLIIGITEYISLLFMTLLLIIPFYLKYFESGGNYNE